MYASQKGFENTNAEFVARADADDVWHPEKLMLQYNYLKNNPDIDLILMDIKMPDMNGYDATRKIREFNSEVIIIAQTAYAFSDDKEKALNAGCNDYISKPIDVGELEGKIQRLVKK